MINLQDIKDKNKSPFEVPEGYFDNLERDIISKAKRRRTIRLTRGLIAAAALVSLALIMPWQQEPEHDLDYVLKHASNSQLYSMMEIIEIDPLDI